MDFWGQILPILYESLSTVGRGTKRVGKGKCWDALEKNKLTYLHAHTLIGFGERVQEPEGVNFYAKPINPHILIRR